MKKPATPDPRSLAVAASMRRFDPHLTDEQIAQIARTIQDDEALRSTLNAKKHPLDNAVAPIAVVRPLP